MSARSPLDINPSLEVVGLHGLYEDKQNKKANEILEEVERLHAQLDEYTHLRQQIIKEVKQEDLENSKNSDIILHLEENMKIQQAFDKIAEFDPSIREHLTSDSLGLTKSNFEGLQNYLKSVTESIQMKSNTKMLHMQPLLIEIVELMRVVSDAIKSQKDMIEHSQRKQN